MRLSTFLGRLIDEALALPGDADKAERPSAPVDAGA